MTTANPWIDDRSVALFTDLYELTMAQAYYAEGMDAPATFSLFVRKLPARRNYLLACGLDDVLHYLEHLRFDADSLDHLASLGQFDDGFLDWLSRLRFTGDVWAVPEGTPVFPDEPILEVTAPIAEAQIAETFIMNQVHLQTTLASKASRVVTAAAGRTVVDFGPRRMHGTDAAVKAARAFHIAGVGATSNVFASKVYGVAATGTMAHSYVEAWDEEVDAFRSFAKRYRQTVLLVDTYDTLRGVDRVCALAEEMGDAFDVRAIRLDSGDLAELAQESRRRLDACGLHDVSIFASSSLDEDAIAGLVEAGAPIDGFGVGTRMGVSQDAPSLDIAYKLVAYAGKGRLKTSTGKPVLPGRKQVFRNEEAGTASGDMVARADEDQPGRPLMQPVMRDGRRTEAGRDTLDAARDRAADELRRLPAAIRGLASAEQPYPVQVSRALEDYRDAVIRERAG
ncbi:MAG: nicotinate phosphoribosyltransferase [Rhodospirillales bacterium]|nr:MAG: nicotinate phosphoribosyltransferase [Rhodospirillales bacterium]